MNWVKSLVVEKGKTLMSGRRRGQAFVELALIMPILLIMIVGMVEVVFAFNDYLQMLDAARNGARDSANLNPIPKASGAYDNNKNCTDPDGAGPQTATNNFWRRTACTTTTFLKPINLASEPPTENGNTCIPASDTDRYTNDIVLSIFTTAVVDSGGSPTLLAERWDNATDSGGPHLLHNNGEGGWSFVMDQYNSPQKRGMCSGFTTSTIRSLLLGATDVNQAAPNTAYLLVEVFYRHYQLFDAPVFGDVIENPIRLHSYAIFSVSAAEATTTPGP